jgi:hypothetical protein
VHSLQSKKNNQGETSFFGNTLFWEAPSQPFLKRVFSFLKFLDTVSGVNFSGKRKIEQNRAPTVVILPAMGETSI